MTNQEAIEYLKQADITVGTDYKTKTAMALEMAIESLENQKTGHWIFDEKGQYVQCSECHIPQYVFSPYCPYCGAKMEGE